MTNINNKGPLQRAVDFYFKPREFERKGTLYRALGMDFFRRYCPNGGSYWSVRTGESWIRGKPRTDLKKTLKLTKQLEAFHTSTLIAVEAMAVTPFILFPHPITYISTAAFTALNLLGNALPIISNRHNRSRIEPLVDRLNQREQEHEERAH